MKIIKKASFVILNTIIFCFMIFGSAANQIKDKSDYTYKVTDYGAIPNDQNDDSRSIQLCFNAASKTGGTILFSEGTYVTSQELNLTLSSKYRNIKIKGNNAKILNVCLPNNILQATSTTGKAIFIENLIIDGQVSNETRNLRQNGLKFTTGIDVRSFDTVFIKNCQVKNIYGNGIYIHLKRYKDSKIFNAKEFISIINNKILNCSGINGGPRKDENGRARPFDNYGDGILYTGGKCGIISNNVVINDLKTVGKVGRAGIALSYYNKDVVISNNIIKGYDRGVHIETTYSGHQAIKNTISDCNIGYINTAYSCDFIQSSPNLLDGNIISDGDYDAKVHGQIIKPYSLIFFYLNADLLKNTIVRNNKLSINHKRYKFSYFLLCGQEDLQIENNEFISKYPGVGTILLHKHVNTFNNNIIKNLYNVQSRSSIDEIEDNEIFGHLNSVLFK